MQVRARIIGFQSVTILHNEITMAGCPSRQAYISNLFLKMIATEIHIRFIYHKRTVSEIKFWRKLFVVSQDLQIILP
jgi:hypothetical protein